MALFVQAVAVFKAGLLHAQSRRFFVHPGHKGLLAAGHVLRQHHRRVVGAHNHRGLNQVVHAHLLPLLQPDVRASHGGRVGRGGQLVLQAELSLLHGLKGQAQGHHLGDGGAGPHLVGVLFKKHLAGSGLHQHRRRGGDFQLLPMDGESGQAQDRGQQGQQKGEFLFHAVIILPGGVWFFLLKYICRFWRT